MLNFPQQLENNEPMLAPVEPVRVLESVVNELEQLRLVSDASTGILAELHGALLLYAVAGDINQLPILPFGLSPRRLLERRVVAHARRIANRHCVAGSPMAAIEAADEVIGALIHLIDPELASMHAMAS